MSASGERPAFYAIGRGTGGPGDWVTLLHPPYTLWHLSYVAIGAAMMPHLVLWRLAGTLVAFFLAVGIGAHALDELNGRPLRTGIPAAVLVTAAVVSVGTAMTMGLVVGGLRLLPFVLVGGFLVCSYNLEWFGGLLHSDVWFGVAWGAFPALTGAYAQHWNLSLAAAIGAASCFFLSLGQRALSTPARALRRRIEAAEALITWHDGTQQRLGRAELLLPLERGLRYFAWAVPVLAVALVVARSRLHQPARLHRPTAATAGRGYVRRPRSSLPIWVTIDRQLPAIAITISTRTIQCQGEPGPNVNGKTCQIRIAAARPIAALIRSPSSRNHGGSATRYATFSSRPIASTMLTRPITCAVAGVRKPIECQPGCRSSR